jgi:hypothetical protein
MWDNNVLEEGKFWSVEGRRRGDCEEMQAMFLEAALVGAKSTRVSLLPSTEDGYVQWLGGALSEHLTGKFLEHNLCGVVQLTLHVCRVPDRGERMW